MSDAKSYKAALMRKLHVIGKEKGFDHDSLSEMAMANYNVSIRGLNIPQLLELIQGLSGDASAPLSDRETGTQPKNNRVRAIYAIGYRSLKWDSQRILDFIEKQVGSRKSVQSLTEDEAKKVIAGMEAIEKWRKRREVSKVRE